MIRLILALLVYEVTPTSKTDYECHLCDRPSNKTACVCGWFFCDNCQINHSHGAYLHTHAPLVQFRYPLPLKRTLE